MNSRAPLLLPRPPRVTFIPILPVSQPPGRPHGSAYGPGDLFDPLRLDSFPRGSRTFSDPRNSSATTPRCSSPANNPQTMYLSRKFRWKYRGTSIQFRLRSLGHIHLCIAPRCFMRGFLGASCYRSFDRGGVVRRDAARRHRVEKKLRIERG